MAEAEKKKVKISPATPMDIAKVARMAERMINDAWGDLPAIDEGRLVNWVNHVIQTGFCIKATISDNPMGAAGMSIIQMPWSNQQMVMLDFFYVVPEFRVRGTETLMVEALEAWAAERQLPIYGGIINGVHPELNKRVNERAEYSKIGLFYIKGR